MTQTHRMARMIAAFGMVMALAACGPVHTTEYQFIPPRSPEGRMCANNCLHAQSNCQHQCAMSNDQCREIERLRGREDYRRYVRERRREGKEVKRSESSFTKTYRCDEDRCQENCASTLHICHTNCGGQIIATTRCTAFCEGQQ